MIKCVWRKHVPTWTNVISFFIMHILPCALLFIPLSVQHSCTLIFRNARRSHALLTSHVMSLLLINICHLSFQLARESAQGCAWPLISSLWETSTLNCVTTISLARWPLSTPTERNGPSIDSDFWILTCQGAIRAARGQVGQLLKWSIEEVNVTLYLPDWKSVVHQL